MTGSERWNHNIHYHPILLGLLPAPRVLDVGCGEGVLTRELADRADAVVGIDADGDQIDLARSTTEAPNVDYLVGDVMTHAFGPASFDVAVSVATLHHLETRAALRRLRELVSPGGRIGVVGVARRRLPHDLFHEAAGAMATRVLQRRRTLWEHSAPIVWPPAHTFSEVRRIADDELPGNNFRHHALWRYSLTWTKPDVGDAGNRRASSNVDSM